MAYRGPLVPNCLLTRFPVCFLHGRKTLFNAFRYWRGIPQFLEAHGYRTFELAVPWRALPETRAVYLETQLNHLSGRFGKVHLITRGAGELDVEAMLARSPQSAVSLQTLTILGRKTSLKRLFTMGVYEPPAPLTDKGLGLLQHCISLAEYDLTHAQ